MKNNPKKEIVKAFRIDSETDNIVKRLCEITGFNRSQIDRYLYNRAIEQLKIDSFNVGGLENLRFDIRELQKINGNKV